MVSMQKRGRAHVTRTFTLLASVQHLHSAIKSISGYTLQAAVCAYNAYVCLYTILEYPIGVFS